MIDDYIHGHLRKCLYDSLKKIDIITKNPENAFSSIHSVHNVLGKMEMMLSKLRIKISNINLKFISRFRTIIDESGIKHYFQGVLDEIEAFLKAIGSNFSVKMEKSFMRIEYPYGDILTANIDKFFQLPHEMLHSIATNMEERYNLRSSALIQSVDGIPVIFEKCADATLEIRKVLEFYINEIGKKLKAAGEKMILNNVKDPSALKLDWSSSEIQDIARNVAKLKHNLQIADGRIKYLKNHRGVREILNRIEMTIVESDKLMKFFPAELDCLFDDNDVNILQTPIYLIGAEFSKAVKDDVSKRDTELKTYGEGLKERRFMGHDLWIQKYQLYYQTILQAVDSMKIMISEFSPDCIGQILKIISKRDKNSNTVFANRILTELQAFLSSCLPRDFKFEKDYLHTHVSVKGFLEGRTKIITKLKSDVQKQNLQRILTKSVEYMERRRDDIQPNLMALLHDYEGISSFTGKIRPLLVEIRYLFKFANGGDSSGAKKLSSIWSDLQRIKQSMADTMFQYKVDPFLTNSKFIFEEMSKESNLLPDRIDKYIRGEAEKEEPGIWKKIFSSTK